MKLSVHTLNAFEYVPLCFVHYTVSSLASITHGTFTGNGDVVVQNVLLDSRKKFNAEATMFVCIRGSQHDGHQYIEQLFEVGIRIFLADHIPPQMKDKSAHFILVKNVLHALQEIAAHHRSTFPYPIVAITGSNGKTIVKEWAYQVMHKHFNIIRSPKSYNSQIGVPLSVLQMEAHHELALIETGISQPDEMFRLETIVKPDIGIFTNIGDAHAKGFANTAQKIHEKLLLFRHSKALIYCADHPQLQEILHVFALENGIEEISWSRKNHVESNVRVELKKLDGQCNVQINFHAKEAQFSLPFSDEASIENAIHVFVLGLHLGLSEVAMKPYFLRLTPIEMRLNQKAALNNCNLVSDFYNADLKSVEIALDWASRQHRGQQKTIILSDIEQSNLDGKSLYTEVNNLLLNHQFNRLIGVGSDISEHAHLFNIPSKIFYPNTSELLKNLDLIQFQNETILLKGGRSFRFEDLEKKLQRQVHNTVLEVNMNALQHNLNFFRNGLNPSTKIMVMVKAYSYGSGGHEIAHFLQYHGVDYLAVAYADEGITLRNDGIKTPIMVMNSDADSFASMLQYNLEPEVFSFKSLRTLITLLQQNPGYTCKVHLELNSGMNRLGFDPFDIPELVKILGDHKEIELASVFSHLASSDMTDKGDQTEKQINVFKAMYDALCKPLEIKPTKHILNSTGILHYLHAQFDMVRLGIGLYGIDPSNVYQDQLEEVGTLWSTISQIREVKSGEGVSYGGFSVANHNRRIAVVAIGYADGLNRGLSQGKGAFNIHGQSAPIVGNICMDMTMCDVTDIACEEGDAVLVFGTSPTINDLSNALNTIPYEVLTSVSQRVKRIFTEE